VQQLESLSYRGWTKYGLAEFERELPRSAACASVVRQSSTRVNVGTLARREKGETLMDIARGYGVSHLTIMRLAASSPFEHGAVVAPR
jgi:hypothetical protein